MRAIGLVGPSGSGKTTLAAALVAHLRAAGQLVSAIKHAGHGFEMDHPGKDSQRLAASGAFEVVVASSRRMAVLREFAQDVDLRVQDLMAELAEPEDLPLWVVFEGFRHASHQKLEFWTGQDDRPALYPEDPFVVGIVTDAPETLPHATGLPIFRRDQAAEIAAFLLRDPGRFEVRDL
jgi:molybdopterin-guanine dinucleotide biosynthesis protein B